MEDLTEANKNFWDFAKEIEMRVKDFVTTKGGTIRDFQYMERQLFRQTEGNASKVDEQILGALWETLPKRFYDKGTPGNANQKS